jgi:hypothetical protein
MLAIQEYISLFDDIEQANKFLEQNASVVAKLDYIELEKNKVFIYNTTKGYEETSRIVREAEGLILDMEANVVCMYPLAPKAMTFAQLLTTNINWHLARIEEMEDGLRCAVYRWQGNWYFATKASATAKQDLEYAEKAAIVFTTAKHEIEEILRDSFGNWSAIFEGEGNPDLCFIFDFVGDATRNIRPYKESDLVLVTIMDKGTGEEKPLEEVDEFASTYGFTRPSYNLCRNHSDALNFFNTAHPLTRGCIITDSNGNRFLLTNPLFVALQSAKIVESFYEKSALLPIHVIKILNACRNAKTLEIVCTLFPKYNPMINIFLRARADLSRAILTKYTIDRNKLLENTNDGTLESAAISSVLARMSMGKNEITIENAVKMIDPRRIITFSENKYPDYNACWEKLMAGGK